MLPATRLPPAFAPGRAPGSFSFGAETSAFEVGSPAPGLLLGRKEGGLAGTFGGSPEFKEGSPPLAAAAEAAGFKGPAATETLALEGSGGAPNFVTSGGFAPGGAGSFFGGTKTFIAVSLCESFTNDSGAFAKSFFAGESVDLGGTGFALGSEGVGFAGPPWGSRVFLGGKGESTKGGFGNPSAGGVTILGGRAAFPGGGPLPWSATLAPGGPTGLAPGSPFCAGGGPLPTMTSFGPGGFGGRGFFSIDKMG